MKSIQRGCKIQILNEIEQKLQRKWIILVLVISCMVAIDNISLNYYGLELHAFFWHLSKPEPLEWNDLEIQVPPKFIAHEEENKNGKNEIHIYSLILPDYGNFFLEHCDYHLKQNFTIVKRYDDMGYIITELDTDANIAGNQCIWIKVIHKKYENFFMEDIYFKTKSIKISYIGSQEKQSIFNNWVNTIKPL